MDWKFSSSRIALVTLAFAAGGFALAFLFGLVQAIDARPDAPLTGPAGQTSSEYNEQFDQYRRDDQAWSDRNRWYDLFENAGRTMISAGLPLGLIALALSRGRPILARETPAEPPIPPPTPAAASSRPEGFRKRP